MNALRLLVWLLPPSRLKNRALRLLGHDIDPEARVHTNLVWRVQRLEVGPGAVVRHLNVIKNMRLVRVGAHATIGRLNVISAHPAFAANYADGAELVLGNDSFVTTLHHLDCSGSFYLGDFAAVAGHQTRVMTHSIDLQRNAQAAYAIRVGQRSFVGTRCLLLGGAELPERSVLAAGAMLVRSTTDGEPGLYVGSPAQRKREVSGAWFDRTSGSTSSIYVPDSGDTVDIVI